MNNLRANSIFDHIFIPGLIVGAITGFIENLVDIALINWLHFGQIRFMDYAGVRIYGRKFSTFGENLFAFWIQICFSASIGVLFLVWLRWVSSKSLHLKGAFLGASIWFFIFVLVILYKVPGVLKVSLTGGVENVITSILFGLLLAETFRLLRKFTNLYNQEH